MEKLVSVIIPAYNVSQYVRQTVFSVIIQSYKNLEIIIVNDGSTDDTNEIINEYVSKDSRIIVINQENKGLASARNTGIKHAKGEYLCIIDSDDIMLPNKIYEQYKFLENNPECDFTYSDLYHFIDGTNKIYHHLVSELSLDPYTSLLYGNAINPNAVFFRRAVYDKWGGFDERLRSAEDWDYWLTLSYNGVNFKYQPLALTLYRMRKNSLSANKITMSITPLEVLKKQLNRKISITQIDIIKKRIQYWEKRLYFSYMQNGNNIKAREIIKNILNHKNILRFISRIPSCIFIIKGYIMKKINFVLYFKKIKNDNLTLFLSELQKNEFTK